MGRAIVKLTDGDKEYYLEWSSIVDAPVTRGMSLAEFKAYIAEEYGRQGLEDLDQRLARVEETGTSYHDRRSAEDVISCNRAGTDEQELSMEEILNQYCREES